LNELTHRQTVRLRFRQLAEARRFAETEGNDNRSLNRNCIALFTLVLFACSGKPYVVEPEEHAGSVRSHRLFVASHGWHTGIIVPARDLNDVAPELENRFGAVPYYEVGWGDKKFYQAREATTGLALQAIFRSEGAVLHVVAIPGDPQHYFFGSEVLETCVTDSGLISLNSFLSDSFTRDSSGQVMALSKGIYRNSQFYLGEGRYNLLNTSNKWTAKALRSAGMDISPAFKLTAGSVMSYLRSNQWPCDGAATAPQQSTFQKEGGPMLGRK
jgi:uncharacterized protein (TIGR02117 family)